MQKKLLNISTFSLKFVMNLLSCNNSGIQGIFLLFKNVFNTEQLDFGLVLGSDNFLDKRTQQLDTDFSNKEFNFEIQTGEQRICGFYFVDITCKLGFPHKLDL